MSKPTPDAGRVWLVMYGKKKRKVSSVHATEESARALAYPEDEVVCYTLWRLEP